MGCADKGPVLAVKRDAGMVGGDGVILDAVASGCAGMGTAVAVDAAGSLLASYLACRSLCLRSFSSRETTRRDMSPHEFRRGPSRR